MKTPFVALSLTLFSLMALAQDGSPTGTCAYQKIPINVFSEPTGINDVGAVVGFASSATDPITRGFLFFNGKKTLFRVPGSENTFALSINNHAQIVGGFTSPNGNRGFVVQSGRFRIITVPNSVSNNVEDINDNGDIVGNVVTSDGVNKAYFLHNGTFHLFRFPGSTETDVASINNQGVIVGLYRPPVGPNIPHGFMVKNGIFTTIDFPGAGPTPTFPTKINNNGDIVGFFAGEDGFNHGFALENGVFRELNTPVNTRTNSPSGVNNHDVIVTTEGFQGNCQAVF